MSYRSESEKVIDWGEFLRWLVTLGPQFYNWLNSGLNTTKNATDAFNGLQKLLPQIFRGKDEPKEEGEEPDLPPDYAVERVRAGADMMRSYAVFGFLEFAAWAGKAIFAYLMFSRLLDYMQCLWSRKE